MESLAKGVRNILASIVSWMDRADKEQEEQVRELLSQPGKDLLPPGVTRGEDGSCTHDPVAAAREADQPRQPGAATSRHPFAPSTARPASESGAPPMPPGARPGSGTKPAGVPMPPVARPKGSSGGIHGIKQHTQDETSYMRRDAVVRLVEERYAHLPPAIQAAILARVLSPDGLKLLLVKLGIESFGVAMADHDQVVDFIEEHGLETFCLRTGIRHDSATAKRSTPPAGTRRDMAKEPRLDPGSAMSRRGEARAKHAQNGADHRMKLGEARVKPVDLRTNQMPPEE